MSSRPHVLPRRRAAALLAVLLATLLVAVAVPSPSQAQSHESWAATVTSIASDAIDIDIQVFKPATASAANPVPVILHSHGWGGTKATSGFDGYLDAGFGVVSITQRGHGASGGLRNVEDPDWEGQDMIAVVDHIAGLDWVLTEEPAPGEPDPWTGDRVGDPVMGAFGGSYGGGYQYVLALTEMRDFGATRMDAMAPDITWHDLNTALAPNDVPRTAWLTALWAAGAAYSEPYISEGFLYGAATGQYPDGTVPVVVDLKGEFATHGPAGYVDAEGERIHLDIPMLITQGFSDNLFNFNEAWDNFTQTLTDEARERSQLVGHNGGHALPNVAPFGYATAGDFCGGNTTTARVAFFTAALVTGGDTRVVDGDGDGIGEPLQYATASGECLSLDLDDIDFEATYSPEEIDSTGTLGPAIGSVTVAGAPISLALAEGPLTIAGVPELTGEVYAAGYDQRLFMALSVGETPATAQVIQNNVMPLRILGPTPSTGEDFAMRLAGVAETVQEGETLYLTVSPVSDMFFGHGSRTPGGVGLTDVEVTIPTVVAD